MPESSFNFGVEDLKNGLFPNWILNHLSDFDFFDWLDNDIIFTALSIIIKLGLEDCSFTEVLETPDHGST
jgi:hypothetical protein